MGGDHVDESRHLSTRFELLGEYGRVNPVRVSRSGRRAQVPGQVSPGSALVRAQAEQEGLDRIFVNLVGNAVKYTPEGGTVTVTIREQELQVAVEVRDTGIGIPENMLEKISCLSNRVLQLPRSLHWRVTPYSTQSH